MNAQVPTTLTAAESRFFYQLPLLVLVIFGCFELLLPSVSSTYAGWPLVLSLVFVGMPHGAVDFRVNSRLRSISDLPSQIFGFLGYCCILATMLAFLLIAPSFTLLLFLVTSAAHFGVADARYLDNLTSKISPPRQIRNVMTTIRLSAFARGTLVITLPFLAAEAASLEVFYNVMAILGKPFNATLTVFIRPAAILFSVSALAAHAIVTTVRIWHGHLRPAAVELLETTVIAFAFWTMHPLFAMGLYVIAWHGWRHMHPLSRFFRDSDLRPSYRSLMQAVCRIHIRSLPLLVPTLIIVGCLAWWRLEAWTSASLAALTITIFVVVTLPHHLLVEQLFAVSHRADRGGSRKVAATNHAKNLPAETRGGSLSTALLSFNLQEEKTWVSR